jgi:gamma-glutamyltranspeptidase / glutathione hydrolase
LRDFQQPGRSAAYAEKGMIASSHPAASLAGLDVLTAGGTAADAAIAAAAVLCMAEPQMTGLGGDCFWVHATTDGRITAYNGSGRTPAAATNAYYAERSISALAPTDPHTVTIPGAADAWERLHESHGSLPMDRLLAPAIRLAEDGCLIHPRVAFDWQRFESRVALRKPARAAFLPGGRVLAAGDRYANPALARTMKAIARDGASAIYRGEVAERLTRTLRAAGGLHSVDDFADHAGEAVVPIRTAYREMEVLECPPNGQGIAVLILLNILTATGQDIAALSMSERVHLFAEATKLAYWERNIWCGDPDFAAYPLERLLSPDHAAFLAASIRPDLAADAPPMDRTNHADTVYLAVVDENLNCVSFINSLFNAFGSGIYDAETGILLHNRGLGFTFTQGHPNTIDARKRPLHTIIPGMILDADGMPIMPFGVMGGHFQAAGHAQFLSHIFDRGLDPQQAADEPRSFAFEGKLQIESSIPPDVLEQLSSRGHQLAEGEGPLGGAQAIFVDRKKGVLIGGSDPRKDGLALGR